MLAVTDYHGSSALLAAGQRVLHQRPKVGPLHARGVLGFVDQKAGVALAKAFVQVAGRLVAQLAVDQRLKLPNRLHPEAVEHVLEASRQLTKHRGAAVVPAKQVEHHSVERGFEGVAEQRLHLRHYRFGLVP